MSDEPDIIILSDNFSDGVAEEIEVAPAREVPDLLRAAVDRYDLVISEETS